jgi:hypothetical protein
MGMRANMCVCLCVGARARLGWLSPCNNRLCWLFRRCLSLSAWIPQLCDPTTTGVTLYIAFFSFSGAEGGSVFTFELESAQNGFSRPTCQRHKIARSGRKSMPGQKGGRCIYNYIYLMRKEINRGPRDPCERGKVLRVKDHCARACSSRIFFRSERNVMRVDTLIVFIPARMHYGVSAAHDRSGG